MPPKDRDAKRQWMRAAIARFERPLTRYAHQITGDLDVARDIVQETFLRLWQAPRESVDDHLAQWLFKVCRNRALDVHRKESRMQTVPQHDNTQVAPGATPPEAMERRESLHQVHQAMEALPDNQREVLRLKFQSGMSYKQISEVTGLSVSNVGYLLHVGIKALRETMAAEAAQGDDRRAS